MKIKNLLQRAGVCLVVCVLIILNAACSENKSRLSGKASTGNSWRTDGSVWPALAMLQTGDNALWFEFGADGPALIESPSSATLSPYLPWPHARFVTGIQFWNNFIVMAVNRDGFLVFGKGRNSGEAVLYRIANSRLWDPYTAESFFLWEGKPAVLLYRNDFFLEPSAPKLGNQVFVLDAASPVPLSVSISALDNFPPPWEAELAHQGVDGSWYFRMKEKGRPEAETAYFRSASLSEKGNTVSIGDWRNSSRPDTPENIPGYLAEVLGRAAEFGITGFSAVKTISSDFDGERTFALEEDEGMVLLFAYCEPLRAFVISPDGRGLYSIVKEGGVRPFSLPSLPEGFFYTGMALLENVVIASWEEQQEAGIGSAGFMVINVL